MNRGKLRIGSGLRLFAAAAFLLLVIAAGLALMSKEAHAEENGYPIMGTTETTVQAMAAYYNARATYPAYYATTDAPDIYTFCQIYMEEATAEGVKPEVAFCQAMKETGFMRYGGDVNIEQFNFAGIGAVGGGAKGASFASVREGIRAQIQHLKAYASKDALVNPTVDPRFKYVTRGICPTVESLDGHWATASGYGGSILTDYMSKLLGKTIVPSTAVEEKTEGDTGNNDPTENGTTNNGSDAGNGTDTPVTHVTTYQGVDYSAVYDPEYYYANNPDVAAACGEDENHLIEHFAVCGIKEGRQGSADFDPASYRNEYADLRAAFGSDTKQYYIHYINYGKREGRHGTGCTALMNAVTTLNGVDYSAVYDYAYYLNNYADLKKAFEGDDVAALRHFVNNGMKEGRQAIADFNVYSYRSRYADLRKAFGSNIAQYYLHYIYNGVKEGRNGASTAAVTPTTVYDGVDYADVYDYATYILNNPDVNNAYMGDPEQVLKHFVYCGMKEGRIASTSFNPHIYRARYTDLNHAFGDNLETYYIHYMRYGKAEGRSAS
ncbi:MAG: glucosaminidase domain-containing protein [Eubacterium sp.]|nr:glucosaminidase domain-containing protein [Eubacterium sp.]